MKKKFTANSSWRESMMTIYEEQRSRYIALDKIPFCREIINGNRPISDDQTIRDMFDEMSKKESYEELKSKSKSVQDP